jgi:flagellar biogenesis protein FliO
MTEEEKAARSSRRARMFVEIIALEAAIIVALWILGRLLP